MRLHALICAYNCEDTIFDCLVSLIGIVDDILILDSRWIGYEVTTNFFASTDGTQTEIFDFIATYHNIEVKYFVGTKEMHQYEARQFLLDKVPEGDWFLVIDTDEIVKAYPQMLKETLDIFAIIKAKGVKIAYAENPEIDPQLGDLPRFFRKTKGLHYTTNHRYLEDDEGPLNYSIMPYTREFQMVHMGKNKKMRSAAERYKHWLAIFEAQNS